jgi:hypothetical protein
MTVPVILAIVGGLALLIGIVGGGVEWKGISIRSIEPITRGILALLGVILLGTAVWLGDQETIPPDRSDRTAVVAASGTANGTPRILNVTACAANDDRSDCINIRQKRNEMAKFPLYQIVEFSDPEGDATAIDFNLVRTDPPNEQVTTRDGVIQTAASTQRAGGNYVGTWYCTGPYRVILSVAVVDRAGNRSKEDEYQVDCTPYFK